MVITNWLTSKGFLSREQAVAFWDALTFPDCWMVGNDGLIGRLDHER